MGEYNKEQRNHLSRAIAYNGGKGKQLKNITDNTMQKKLIRCIRNSNVGCGKTLQMTIYNSATYPPNPLSTPHITALHACIPWAELAASNAVQNIALPLNYIHTPTQAAYMANPTPALWGSCVEEKLNPYATANGWALQVRLSGARPDYYKNIGNANVWVDLTTDLQAGIGGNHITGKLDAAIANGAVNNNWEAADITHAGLDPRGAGPLPAPITNGIVTMNQMNKLQSYNAYITNPNSLYDEQKYRLAQIFKYSPIHHTVFTQTWTNVERINFARRATLAGF